MSNEEFINLYSRQNFDESITPFQDGIGFSLIRLYPKSTPYYNDNNRMFIKIAISDHNFFYGVNMTKPQKRDGSVSYTIIDGNKYNKKITNFFSDDNEFIFDKILKKVVHQPTGNNFTINEFIDILETNHLSDRLFFKRIWNECANWGLKCLFWLSDAHYERIQVMIDKFHYNNDKNPLPKDEKKPIEPFFKYFYISKNILFLILLITFPSAVYFGHRVINGDFSISNPSLILFFFLILFSCEKFSIWLDKKIKKFITPSKNHFAKKKINFMEKLHNYQYNNNFDLRLNIRNYRKSNNA